MSLVSAIPETIKEIGRIRAQGAAASGQWGQSVADIGQMASTIPAQMKANDLYNQQSQQRAQQLEMGSLDLAEKRREAAANEALGNAFSTSLNADGTVNIPLLTQHLSQNPKTASSIPKIVESLNKMQESGISLQENQTKLGISREELQGKEADEMGALGHAAEQPEDPNDQAGILLAGVASRVKKGLMTQEEANPIIAGLMGDDGNPDPEKVKGTIARLKAASKEQRTLADTDAQKQAAAENALSAASQRDQVQLDRQKANYLSQLASANTSGQYARIYTSLPVKVKTAIGDVVDPPEAFDPKTSPQRARMAGMTPEQQQQAIERQTKPSGANPTPTSLAVAAAQGDPTAIKALDIIKSQKASAEGGAVQIPGKADIPDVAPGERNEPYLKSLPSSQQALVKALVDGRKAFPSGTALRSDYWQGMLGAVAKYDPSFDEVNYNARAATRKDFTSGKSAQQINALNTVVGHIAQLSDAADALHNRDMKTYNEVVNGLMSEFGWTGKTDFDTIAPKVAQELTRVWRGTGGSEADIARDIDTLSSSNAPAQLHSSIANLGGLVESKLDALKETYRQGMGTEPVEMISPTAQKDLDRIEARAGRAPTTKTAVTPAVKVGDVVTVRGQRVKVTKIGANGQYEGTPVP